MIDIGAKTKRETVDYHLLRYVCYLIVQNANLRKKAVALDQIYFVIQIRKQVITELGIFKINWRWKKIK